MDTAQILLIVVIVVLTFLLLVLGIQVFFILRELKNTISKANKVLDNTDVITESISQPLSSLSNITSGVKIGAMIASFLKGKKSEKEKK